MSSSPPTATSRNISTDATTWSPVSATTRPDSHSQTGPYGAGVNAQTVSTAPPNLSNSTPGP